MTRNEGLVEVGTSRNTARFAVDSIRRWWKIVGKKKYPHAKRLLILADSGGSNGCRIWMWKKLLGEFATEAGLTITVRHDPRGASKCRKIKYGGGTSLVRTDLAKLVGTTAPFDGHPFGIHSRDNDANRFEGQCTMEPPTIQAEGKRPQRRKSPTQFQKI